MRAQARVMEGAHADTPTMFTSGHVIPEGAGACMVKHVLQVYTQEQHTSGILEVDLNGPQGMQRKLTQPTA